MGKWTAGVLSAVAATVIASLILSSLSDDGEPTETDPGREEATDPGTDVEDPPNGVAGEAERLLLTTFVWDAESGWEEHASWVSDTTETSFAPIISAYNWSPDYPALTVRFDDFMTDDSFDDFAAGPLSSLWTSHQPTAGVTAQVDGGELVVSIDEGKTASSFEQRVDLVHAITVEGDFDISVRFSLNDDFYSLSTGGLSLSIVGIQEFQAFVTLQGNSYQTQEISNLSMRTLAGTPADDFDGGLRMRATTVAG